MSKRKRWYCRLNDSKHIVWRWQRLWRSIWLFCWRRQNRPTEMPSMLPEASNQFSLLRANMLCYPVFWFFRVERFFFFFFEFHESWVDLCSFSLLCEKCRLQHVNTNNIDHSNKFAFNVYKIKMLIWCDSFCHYIWIDCKLMWFFRIVFSIVDHLYRVAYEIANRVDFIALANVAKTKRNRMR